MKSEFCFILGLMLVFACSNSNPTSPEPDKPPQVPSNKSVAFDLSIFSSQKADPGENYLQADTTIGKIQAIKGRNINIVRNLFEEADTADAEKLEKGKWQWKITNKKGRLNIGFRLVAIQKSGDKIKWKVYITNKHLQKEELLFITGTSNREVTEGVWTYRSFPRSGQPSQDFATLDWKIDNSGNTKIILEIVADTFSDISSGSKMTYTTEGAVRTIVLNPADKQETTNIKFNSDTNVGFIIAPDYKNGKKACWNSNFQNVKCSEISLS